MNNEKDFLLGYCFAILKQARAHMIRKQDTDGVELIEDDFLAILSRINKTFNMEQGDDK